MTSGAFQQEQRTYGIINERRLLLDVTPEHWKLNLSYDHSLIRARFLPSRSISLASSHPMLLYASRICPVPKSFRLPPRLLSLAPASCHLVAAVLLVADIAPNPNPSSLDGYLKSADKLFCHGLNRVAYFGLAVRDWHSKILA